MLKTGFTGMFQRPTTNQLIKQFSMWGTTNDLYINYDFVRECKGFDGLWIGNKNFSLDNPDPALNEKNRETLMIMLKKCKHLTLQRIEKTHQIYDFIGHYAESF